MNMRIRMRGWCAALALLGLACGGSASQQSLIITGSSTVAPLMSEIARRFEERNPGVRVDVQTGGSSRGIADARKGLAEVGMVSRAGKPDESDLRWFTIARDGIAIIVDASNPVRSLSADQVRAIYRGEIENWSEVGGNDLPITLVHKAQGRSTLELFLSHFGLEDREVSPDVVVGDNEQGIKTVAGDPQAIGYVSIGTAEYQAGRGTSIKLVELDGVESSVASVKRGEFPLSRPLSLVTSGEPEGVAADLIAFAQSKDVHDLVEAQFFVPVE